MTAKVLLKMQQVQTDSGEVHIAQRLYHWVMGVPLMKTGLASCGSVTCSKQLTHRLHTFVSARSRLGSADGASMLISGISCNSHLKP